MKPRFQLISRPGARALAFTLPELMVSMAIFLLMISATITAHLYGIRMFELIKPKLNASDEARTVISKLLDDVRSASTVTVGSGSISNFTAAPVNSLLQGNALQICPTTNTSAFIVYFRDPSDQKLKRCTNGAKTAVTVASSITNQIVFSAEDFGQHTLTNYQNGRTVVALSLKFCQLPFTTTTVGPKGLYDYFEVRTRITKR
jgi:prepilin-type N-terminal cleavage/methylation domain-containing protein